jgi:hypothetical protein
MEPVQPSPRHPSSNPVFLHPDPHELPERDHPVLTLGNPCDHSIDWRTFFPHGEE